MSENEKEFVAVSLSKKQIDYEHIHTSENGKEYVRCLAPEGGSFWILQDSLKEHKDNTDKVYFVRPKGTEISITYSERVEGIPDDASPEEKYNKITKVVLVEDLKQNYDNAKKLFAAEKATEREAAMGEVLSILVSEQLVHSFEHDGKAYQSVSVPVLDEKDNKEVFYKIVVSDSRCTKIEGDNKYSISINENYEFTAKRSVKNESTGDYDETSIKMTGKEVRDNFIASKDRFMESQLKNESEKKDDQQKEESKAEAKSEEADQEKVTHKANTRRKGR